MPNWLVGTVAAAALVGGYVAFLGPPMERVRAGTMADPVRAAAPAPPPPASRAVADLSGLWWDRADGGVVCREGVMSPAQLIQRIEGMGAGAEVAMRGPRDAPEWVFVAGGPWMTHFYRSHDTCRRAAMAAHLSAGG
jgi:hypothetical protein